MSVLASLVTIMYLFVWYPLRPIVEYKAKLKDKPVYDSVRWGVPVGEDAYHRPSHRI